MTEKPSTFEDRVRAFLAGHAAMTLATSRRGEPWAASVFYASSDALELFFVSAESSRHSQDVASAPEVAVTINGEGRDWDAIRGLQIRGECIAVSPEERPPIEQLYLAKFPTVARLVREPADDDERKVAARFRSGRFYRVTPRWIRFIDNTRGFAQREERVMNLDGTPG